MNKIDPKQIQRMAREAHSEFRSILRIKGARPDMGEVLERELFDVVGSLEPSANEREMLEKYLRAYVFLGEPAKAAQLSEKTRTSLNWTEETDVVNNGYRLIVTGSVLRLGEDVEVSYSGIRQLRQMRELTGVEIPKDIHNYFLDVILKLWTSEKIYSALKVYLEASAVTLTQEEADKLYSAVSAYGTGRAIETAIKIFELTGISPDDAFDSLLTRYSLVDPSTRVGLLQILPNKKRVINNLYDILGEPADPASSNSKERNKLYVEQALEYMEAGFYPTDSMKRSVYQNIRNILDVFKNYAGIKNLKERFENLVPSSTFQ